jgi:hypothetical protein
MLVVLKAVGMVRRQQQLAETHSSGTLKQGQEQEQEQEQEQVPLPRQWQRQGQAWKGQEVLVAGG